MYKVDSSLPPSTYSPQEENGCCSCAKVTLVALGVILFTIGVYLYKIEGAYWTPPSVGFIAAGLVTLAIAKCLFPGEEHEDTFAGAVEVLGSVVSDRDTSVNFTYNRTQVVRNPPRLFDDASEELSYDLDKSETDLSIDSEKSKEEDYLKIAGECFKEGDLAKALDALDKIEEGNRIAQDDLCEKIVDAALKKGLWKLAARAAEKVLFSTRSRQCWMKIHHSSLKVEYLDKASESLQEQQYYNLEEKLLLAEIAALYLMEHGDSQKALSVIAQCQDKKAVENFCSEAVAFLINHNCPEQALTFVTHIPFKDEIYSLLACALYSGNEKEALMEMLKPKWRQTVREDLSVRKQNTEENLKKFEALEKEQIGAFCEENALYLGGGKPFRLGILIRMVVAEQAKEFFESPI